jgi:long-chain acyl-CoA synthetase
MPTFYSRFQESAEKWPQRVAVEIQRRDRLESFTYTELLHMAESVGRWLTENKVKPGERCAILADNGPRWVASYLGAVGAGCVAVPLDTAFHADQVSKLLKDSGASLLFCDMRHLDVAEKAADGKGKLVILDRASVGDPKTSSAGSNAADFDSILKAGPGNFKPFTADENDLVALLYTSGTTADPKGVMLTHANLMGEVASVFARLHITQTDAILGLLPLFHALAQMANLLLPLVTGARVVYLETLNTTELLRALRERDISAFCVVPQFFYLIHERIFKEITQRGKIVSGLFRALMGFNRITRRVGLNLGKIFFGRIHETFGSKMRFLVTGGSRFDPKIGWDFYALGIDVLQAYGLTETSGGAVTSVPGHNVIGSVGRALPGVEVKILDPQKQEDMGQPVGEIAIRGSIVMKGYWNRADATAQVLKEGWLHTGDLGYLDHTGNLYITGRKKEMIVLASGKNIYPEEIEAQYLKSPFIREICVLGLTSAPGEPFSERLHAVIVPNFDVLKERKIVNAREVIRWDVESLSAQLPSTKRILSYDIWQDELPRTTTRKIKRFEVEKRVKLGQTSAGPEADKAEAELSEEQELWLDQPQVKRALAVVREASKSERGIRPDSNLELDLGLDSMQRIELLTAIERELSGKVDESQLSEIYTVRDLVDAVIHSAGSTPTDRPQFSGWASVLASDPGDMEVLALRKPRPVSTAFWYALGQLLAIFARDRFDLKIRGLENLPPRGPYMLCSNHQSFIDPVVMGAFLPWNVFREIFSVGTSEIFGSGFMHWLAGTLRVVVVDPDANLVPAMKAGAYGLRWGMVLIIYPEGERSIDGKPKRFRKGAAILSTHLKVPIVPVAIDGFYDVWPRGKRFFQKIAPLWMSFGPPIMSPAGEPSEKLYDEVTKTLQDTVTAMWEQLRREKKAREETSS